MVEQGVGKRLNGERGSLSHRNLDSQDPTGVEIEHGRHKDLLSVLYQFSEVRCPDVVGIGGHDHQKEVGIGPGNLGFSPFPASPAVGLDAKLTHDPLRPLAAQSQCPSKSPRAVGGMNLQLFFQADLEAPVLLFHSWDVIQACAGYAQGSGKLCFVSSFAQLFFWAIDSLSVISPTSSSSSLFCFCRRENSAQDGAPVAPFTIQP